MNHDEAHAHGMPGSANEEKAGAQFILSIALTAIMLVDGFVCRRNNPGWIP